MLGQGEQPPALPAPPLFAGWRRDQGETQASVQRQDGGAEPFADQRVGNALRTNAFLAVIQEQAVSAIVVAATMHQSPGGAVLLIGHVRDF